MWAEYFDILGRYFFNFVFNQNIDLKDHGAYVLRESSWVQEVIGWFTLSTSLHLSSSADQSL